VVFSFKYPLFLVGVGVNTEISLASLPRNPHLLQTELLVAEKFCNIQFVILVRHFMTAFKLLLSLVIRDHVTTCL